MSRFSSFGIIFLICLHLFAKPITDEMNRTIVVQENPSRIISLAPNITEIIFELKGENKLVAVSAFSNFPNEAQALPQIGTYTNPNLEKIITLKPDLAIGTAEGLTPEIAKKFESLKIPLYVVFPKDINSLSTTFQNIGNVIGLSTSGNSLKNKFDKALESFKTECSNYEKLTFAYFIETNPLFAAGQETFIGSLFKTCNFTNILKDPKTRFPQLSPEFLLTENPDFIFLATFNNQDKIIFSKKYRNLKAIKNGNLYLLDTDVFNRASPRLTAAMTKILEIRKNAKK